MIETALFWLAIWLALAVLVACAFGHACQTD